MTDVSTIRLYALRVMYLLNFALLGATVWPTILNPDKPLGLLDGVAFSFWATLSLLCGLGLRYPLQMLPMLMTQLCYKTIWLLAVALPLWKAGTWNAQASEFTKTFIGGVVLDLIVIPWGYVLANYVRRPGDRWRLGGAPAVHSTSKTL